MKNDIIIKVLFVLAVLGFITYLATRNSAFMFCGGLLMIVAGIMLIISKKNK